MAEQSQEPIDLAEEASPVVVADPPREITDAEKKLRREVARYREQARIAMSERDAAVSTAARERDDAIAAVREEARGHVLQAELRAHATRAGILDLDALKLADLGAISFDENGDIVGIDEAIASLRDRKPYLFGADVAALAPGTTTQTHRPPQAAKPAAIDARGLSREAWRTERDRLLAGKR